MTVAAQTTIRGRPAPLDRHRIPKADKAPRGSEAVYSCSICGRKLDLAIFYTRGERAPTVFWRHTGPRV